MEGGKIQINMNLVKLRDIYIRTFVHIIDMNIQTYKCSFWDKPVIFY